MGTRIVQKYQQVTDRGALARGQRPLAKDQRAAGVQQTDQFGGVGAADAPAQQLPGILSPERALARGARMSPEQRNVLQAGVSSTKAEFAETITAMTQKSLREGVSDVNATVANRAAFTDQVGNEIGMSSANLPIAGPAREAARKETSAGFNRIFDEHAPNVRKQDISSEWRTLERDLDLDADGTGLRKLNKEIKQIEKAEASGNMTAKSYASLRNRLSRDLTSALNKSDPEAAFTIKEMIEVIDDLLLENAPAAAKQELRQLRREWRIQKILERPGVVSKTDNLINPASFANAYNGLKGSVQRRGGINKLDASDEFDEVVNTFAFLTAEPVKSSATSERFFSKLASRGARAAGIPTP